MIPGHPATALRCAGEEHDGVVHAFREDDEDIDGVEGDALDYPDGCTGGVVAVVGVAVIYDGDWRSHRADAA